MAEEARSSWVLPGELDEGISQRYFAAKQRTDGGRPSDGSRFGSSGSARSGATTQELSVKDAKEEAVERAKEAIPAP